MKRTAAKKVHPIRRAIGSALVYAGGVMFSAGVMIRFGTEAHARWEESMTVAAAYLRAGGGKK